MYDTPGKFVNFNNYVMLVFIKLNDIVDQCTFFTIGVTVSHQSELHCTF